MGIWIFPGTACSILPLALVKTTTVNTVMELSCVITNIFEHVMSNLNYKKIQLRVLIGIFLLLSGYPFIHLNGWDRA